MSQFEKLEEQTKGRIKFILCPHLAERGHPDRRAKFVHLIDNKEVGSVQLVLCGVCCDTVIGSLAADIFRRMNEGQDEH